MGIMVQPATDFDAVATLLGPKNPDSNVCFCLSYRHAVAEDASDPRVIRG